MTPIKDLKLIDFLRDMEGDTEVYGDEHEIRIFSKLGYMKGYRNIFR